MDSSYSSTVSLPLPVDYFQISASSTPLSVLLSKKCRMSPSLDSTTVFHQSLINLSSASSNGSQRDQSKESNYSMEKFKEEYCGHRDFLVNGERRRGQESRAQSGGMISEDSQKKETSSSQRESPKTLSKTRLIRQFREMKAEVESLSRPLRCIWTQRLESHREREHSHRVPAGMSNDRDG